MDISSTKMISQATLEPLPSARPPGDGQEEMTGCEDTSKQNSGDIVLSKNSASTVEYQSRQGSSSLKGSPNQGSLSCLRWAQNLQNLLNDIEGIELFMQYLQQEGQNTQTLDFLFACAGIRRKAMTGPLHHSELSLIRLIQKQYVRGISDIRSETKAEIAKKIASKVGIDRTIFDVAQREVETVIMKTTYPNFLKSDLYVQHVQKMQIKLLSSEQEQIDPSSEKNCTENSVLLTNDSKDSSPQEDLDLARQSPSPTARVQHDPLNNLATVFEDSELTFNREKRAPLKPPFQSSKFSIDALCRARPEASLYKAKTPGYDSCYSKYSAYVPPSAQDSELQSLSSDAQTEDTISLASSVECGPVSIYQKRPPRNDQCMRHHRSSKYSGPMNSDHLVHSQFIPRTERMPTVSHLEPPDFANLLISKLNKVKEEQRLKDKLLEFQDNVKGVTSPDRECQKEIPPRALANFPKAGTAAPPGKPNACMPLFVFGKPPIQDTAQSILDEHVSRIWHDSAHQTPSPSPGCLTPQDALVLPDAACARQRSQQCKAAANRMANNMPTYQYSHYNYKVHHNPTYLPGHESNRHRREHEACLTDNGSFSVFAEDIKLLHSAALFNQQQNQLNLHQQDNDFGVEVPFDYSSRPQEREYSRLGASSGRKFSSGHDSASSCFDSGISGTDISNSSSQKRSGNRKSYPGSMPSNAPLPANENTVVAYSFGRGSVPFLSKIPGKNVTLKQLKNLIAKKGNFRYFFKKVSEDFGVVFEEVTDDNSLLPLFEGKIFSIVENVDC